MKEIALWI